MPDVADVVDEATPHMEPATVRTTAGSRVIPHARHCDRWVATPGTVTWAYATATAGSALDEVHVVRYGPGGHYRPHTDTGPGMPRRTTVVIQLSDPATYRGGELVVAGRVQPRTAGACITFPASTTHTVRPVRAGVRWVIVAWVHARS